MCYCLLHQSNNQKYFWSFHYNIIIRQPFSLSSNISDVINAAASEYPKAPKVRNLKYYKSTYQSLLMMHTS